MILLIQSNTTKQLYKTINISILLFTIIWVILFTLQLFSYPLIELLSIFLMLVSALIFIIGVVSAVISAVIDKTQEISTDQVQQLLLNIAQKDYEKGEFTNIKPDNNFILVANNYHDVTYDEALKLLKIAIQKGIEIKLKQQTIFYSLDQNPKQIFNNCMGMLWAAS